MEPELITIPAMLIDGKVCVLAKGGRLVHQVTVPDNLRDPETFLQHARWHIASRRIVKNLITRAFCAKRSVWELWATTIATNINDRRRPNAPQQRVMRNRWNEASRHIRRQLHQDTRRATASPWEKLAHSLYFNMRYRHMKCKTHET